MSSLLTVNVSAGKKWTTQRGNESLSDCNPASHLMGLRYMGFEEEVIPAEHRKNAIMYIINAIKNDSYVTHLFNTDFKGYKEMGYEAHQVHELFVIAFNRLVGIKDFITFKTDWDLKELFFDNVKGKPFVTNGEFTRYGHIVCSVGFTTIQNNIFDVKKANDIDLMKVQDAIIDDAYGDWNLRYSGNPSIYTNGDDIRIKLKEYNDVVRQVGILEKKWGYRYNVEPRKAFNEK